MPSAKKPVFVLQKSSKEKKSIQDNLLIFLSKDLCGALGNDVNQPIQGSPSVSETRFVKSPQEKVSKGVKSPQPNFSLFEVCQQILSEACRCDFLRSLQDLLAYDLTLPKGFYPPPPSLFLCLYPKGVKRIFFFFFSQKRFPMRSQSHRISIM